MNNVKDQVELIRGIKSGTLSKKQVNAEIKRMEELYGEDAFTSYKLQPKKKPWTKEYYQELKDLGTVGAGSKEYILHLVEVRDALKHRKWCCVLLCVCAALVIVLGTIMLKYKH